MAEQSGALYQNSDRVYMYAPGEQSGPLRRMVGNAVGLLLSPWRSAEVSDLKQARRREALRHAARSFRNLTEPRLTKFGALNGQEVGARSVMGATNDSRLILLRDAHPEESTEIEASTPVMEVYAMLPESGSATERPTARTTYAVAIGGAYVQRSTTFGVMVRGPQGLDFIATPNQASTSAELNDKSVHAIIPDVVSAFPIDDYAVPSFAQ